MRTYSRRRVVSWALAVSLGGLSLVIVSCPPVDAARGCRAQVAREAWHEARKSCERAYETGDTAAGGALASVYLLLGESEAAGRVAERLRGTSHEATGLRVLGVLSTHRHEHEEGRALLTSALSQHAARGERVEAARDAHALAGSYWTEGRFREALSALSVSQAHAEAAGDATRGAMAAIGRGDVWRRIGDAQRARASYAAAEAWVEGRPSARADLRLKQGLFELELGRAAVAKPLLTEALQLARGVGRPDLVEAALLNLAWAARERGALEEAAAHLDAVTDRASPDHAVLRASLAAARGDLEAERTWLLAARDTGFGEWGYRLPLERARLARRMGDVERAKAELSTSIAHVEALRATEAGADLQPWIIQRRRAPYEAMVELLLTSSRPDEALPWVDALASRVVLERLMQADPDDPSESALDRAEETRRVAGSWTEWRAPSRAALGPREGETIAWVDGDHRSYAIRIDGGDSGEVQVRDLGPREEVSALRDSYCGDIDRTEIASALGDRLLPFALPPSARPLHVVLTGEYRCVAPAALRVGGRYLVELRPLVIVPTLWAPPPRKDEGLPRRPAMVLADAHSDLSAARAEGEAVARVLDADLRSGASATRRALFEGLDGDVLHVATHAELTPGGARLLLSDGPVTVGELAERVARAHLVVVASCASAASRERDLSGSLAAGFLVAGARSVVGTLWSVSDRAALEVVQGFYALDGVRDPARALASSQRAASRTSPPSRWAPFVVLQR